MLDRLRSIVQQVNAAGDIEQIFDIIVSELSDVMQAEICSIYLANDDKSSLTLAASRGLNPKLIKQAVLTTGQGIVGEVFSKAEHILTDNAPEHEAYFPLQDSGETDAHVFLGVPLIYHSQPLGVLVIQRFTGELFT
ncbi:MAG: GAF domain-containing protein [Gammaproteobacteria bacterium]